MSDPSSRLHAAVAAVCPIRGVSVGAWTPGTPAAVSVQYDPAATQGQQTAAQTAVSAFDWTQAAQDAFDAQQAGATLGRATGVRLTVDRSSTSTAFADVTGLALPLAAGQSYAFQFDGAYTAAAATTGLQLALNGPSFSSLAAVFEVYESATTPRVAVAAAYDVGVNGTASAAATALPFRIFGNVTTTAAGLMVVRGRSEVSGSAVTVKAGSYGILTPAT
jgi:hypothetical protein